jgi:hypothetical protein
MKPLLFVLLISAFSISASADEPNEKVLSAFKAVFSNAKQVVWTESNISYEVRFEQDEVSARITYDKEGKMLRALRYYKEQKLPFLVMQKIKEQYAGKNIYGVVEETTEEGTYYHVTLEDDKRWIEILADSMGTLTLQKKFKKA